LLGNQTDLSICKQAKGIGTKDLAVVDAYHMPDSETLIVPNVYARLPHYSYPDPAQDYTVAKQFYLRLLEDDPSNCTGCCQYIKHSYYRYPKSFVLQHWSLTPIPLQMMNKLLFVWWLKSQVSTMWMTNAPFESKGI